MICEICLFVNTFLGHKSVCKPKLWKYGTGLLSISLCLFFAAETNIFFLSTSKWQREQMNLKKFYSWKTLLGRFNFKQVSISTLGNSAFEERKITFGSIWNLNDNLRTNFLLLPGLLKMINGWSIEISALPWMSLAHLFLKHNDNLLAAFSLFTLKTPEIFLNLWISLNKVKSSNKFYRR